MVQVMVGVGVAHETIARNVGDGIAVNTLKKHFADELKTGRDQLVLSLKMQLVKAANNGSVRAQLALLERLGGPEWLPRQLLGGIPDAPIAIAADAQVTIYLPDNGRGDGRATKPDNAVDLSTEPHAPATERTGPAR
jgi:hypothetical protein